MDVTSYGQEQEEDEILASGARKSIVHAGVQDDEAEPITMSEEQAYQTVTTGNLLE